jgi:hypothetical protein
MLLTDGPSQEAGVAILTSKWTHEYQCQEDTLQDALRFGPVSQRTLAICTCDMHFSFLPL